MSSDYAFAGKIRGDVSIYNNLTKMESNVKKTGYACIVTVPKSMIDTKI